MSDGREAWRESEATVERVERLFANPLLARCLYVDLMGGEPLLVRELGRIVRLLTEQGRITNVSTNGFRLAERIDELKLAGISRINVSLYDENRAVTERDLTSVNRVFPVHTSLVLQRSALRLRSSDLVERAVFIRDSGALSLRIFMYRPMGMAPQLDELIEDDDLLYLEFRRRMEAAVPGFCVWPPASRPHDVEKRCAQLWQRINVDMLGDIGICCGIDTNLPGPGNNLFDAAPDVVFNHPMLVDMRKKLLEPESAPPDACKRCHLLGEPGW